MSSNLQNDQGFISRPANAALDTHTRVTLNSSGKVIAAGNTIRGIGTIVGGPALAADDIVTIKLWTQGSHEMIVADDSAAVVVGNVAYAIAGGKVTGTGTAGTTQEVGIFAEATTEDGAIVEVLPH